MRPPKRMISDPANCRDMTELRAVIDTLDRELVELFAARVACIDRAVELKAAEGLPARIEDRIERVVGNVRRTAEERGLDPEFAEHLWSQIIEWSIRREEIAFAEQDVAAR